MSDFARPVPEALRELVQRWDTAGRRPQRPTAWSLRPWQAALPEHREYLASLPNPIDRFAVIDLCRGAQDHPTAAARGFIAAMVWGYGRVGYGPYRTARVLAENAEAGDRLAEVARRAMRDGGPAAFEWFAEHRLRGLGVAFGTKYLFFCAAASDRAPAPVLDRLVQGWLVRNAGWSMRLDWRVDDYRAYVAAVVAWAAELGVEPADVEYVMFADAAASDPTSQWSERAFATGGSVEPLPVLMAQLKPEGAAVLEALDDAADAFAELPDSSAADGEDFERAVRQLRRIVLARPRR